MGPFHQERPAIVGRAIPLRRATLLRRTDRSKGISMGARTLGLAGVILMVLSPQIVAAQTSRFALDAVAAADVDHGSQVTRKSTAWFDVFGAVRIADNLDLRVRPVVVSPRVRWLVAGADVRAGVALRAARTDRPSRRRRAVHVADRPEHSRESSRTRIRSSRRIRRCICRSRATKPARRRRTCWRPPIRSVPR